MESYIELIINQLNRIEAKMDKIEAKYETLNTEFQTCKSSQTNTVEITKAKITLIMSGITAASVILNKLLDKIF